LAECRGASTIARNKFARVLDEDIAAGEEERKKRFSDPTSTFFGFACFLQMSRFGLGIRKTTNDRLTIIPCYKMPFRNSDEDVI
jgi:hypothetical protein